MLAISEILFIFILQFGNNEIKAPFGYTAFCRIPRQPDCLCVHSGSFRMKEIYVHPGFTALVDDEDFEYLSLMRWNIDRNSNGINYARSSIKIPKTRHNITISMHRLILNYPNNLHVDHINHNGLDNRKVNLRAITHRQNHCNRKIQSEYIGVTKHHNKYTSRAYINGIHCYLGLYNTAIEAHEVYLKAVSQQIIDICKITEKDIEKNLNLFT